MIDFHVGIQWCKEVQIRLSGLVSRRVFIQDCHVSIVTMKKTNNVIDILKLKYIHNSSFSRFPIEE